MEDENIELRDERCIFLFFFMLKTNLLMNVWQ